jgi:hypothetical protein
MGEGKEFSFRILDRIVFLMFLKSTFVIKVNFY